MNKLLKNPLFLFIFSATAISLIGYLRNQLPSIPDFPHKDLLISGAVIIVVIIVTLLIAWGTYQQAQQQLEDPPEQIDPTLRPRLLEAEEIKVKKRSQDSLHLSLMIELDTQEQPERVGRNPLQPLYTISANHNTSPPQQINRMVDVLQRIDIGGRLLILGQPGGGKTTTLLNLAKELLETAKRDDTAPMPFMFELSAWRDHNVNILDWLIIQLKKEYELTPEISRFWLEQGDILPLLDGLDELGLERQTKCIKAINQYLGEDAKRDLVVCCREEEYHTGEEQLTQLHGAVCLQQLLERQIQDYLNQLKRPDLWQAIQINAEFLELARTPLLLSMIVVAYQGRAIQTKQDLFDAYIERRFNLLPVGKGEPQRKKNIHFLAFLAKQLQKTQTEFLIENMQPDWLQNHQQRWLYKLIVGLIGGLIVGLINGLIGGLIDRLNYEELEQILRQNYGSINFHVDGQNDRLITGLITGLYGLTGGLILTSSSIESAEEIQLSVKRLKIHVFLKNFTLCLNIVLILGLINGLNVGLSYGRNYGLIYLLIDRLFDVLIYGLIYGLIFGLIAGLIKGLKSDLKTKFKQNQGIRASFTNTLFITVFITVIFIIIRILLFWFSQKLSIPREDSSILNLFQTSTFLFALLFSGGLACIQHVSLRLLLWHSGYIPWNYAKFLNRAAERRLIQQVGGRYRFIHRLLLDHFANMRLS